MPLGAQRQKLIPHLCFSANADGGKLFLQTGWFCFWTLHEGQQFRSCLFPGDLWVLKKGRMAFGHWCVWFPDELLSHRPVQCCGSCLEERDIGRGVEVPLMIINEWLKFRKRLNHTLFANEFTNSGLDSSPLRQDISLQGVCHQCSCTQSVLAYTTARPWMNCTCFAYLAQQAETPQKWVVIPPCRR